VEHLSRRLFISAALSAAAVAVGGRLRAAELASLASGKRIALSGYDPVSYFDNGRPEKGSREFWVVFGDAVYLFSSANHRELFVADPERYAPQYHGYCTIKMSQGKRAEADPEAWIIMGGKLYVFRSKKGRDRFNTDRAKFVTKANAAWQTLDVAK
jgi:YHS domain-containing protein